MLPKVKLKGIYNIVFFKNFIDSIIRYFPMILSMLDNEDIGLQFEQNSFDSFLFTSVTLATFGMDENTPDEKSIYAR